jgi:hypothetical protein
MEVPQCRPTSAPPSLDSFWQCHLSRALLVARKCNPTRPPPAVVCPARLASAAQQMARHEAARHRTENPPSGRQPARLGCARDESPVRTGRQRAIRVGGQQPRATILSKSAERGTGRRCSTICTIGPRLGSSRRSRIWRSWRASRRRANICENAAVRGEGVARQQARRIVHGELTRPLTRIRPAASCGARLPPGSPTGLTAPRALLRQTLGVTPQRAAHCWD